MVERHFYNHKNKGQKSLQWASLLAIFKPAVRVKQGVLTG